MNNLLISEPPMIVLPSLVMALGNTDKAIMLQQIHYWLLKSTNVRDGHKWVYNSIHDWSKQFPWLSEKTVQRYLHSLESEGLLITGNFNKLKFDRTKWYRIDYNALDKLTKRKGLSIPTNGTSNPNPKGTRDLTNTRDYTETTTDIDDDDRPTSKKEESLIKGYEVFNHDLTKLEQSTLISLIRKLPIETAEEVFDECSLRDSDDSLAYLIKSLQNAIKANGGGSSD